MIFVGKMMISVGKKMIFVNEKTISENKPSLFLRHRKQMVFIGKKHGCLWQAHDLCGRNYANLG